MADERIAIYVYEKSSVTIDPSSSVDLMWMSTTDYTAKYETTISSSTTADLQPGVYGFIYNGTHGVSGPSTITIVTDTYDLQRKNPWPTPPPPPPPPFDGRTDWADHTTVFLVPLGASLDLSGDTSTSGP